MNKALTALMILTMGGPTWRVASGKVDFKADYRTANRDSAHLAPDPRVTREAVVEAYSARAFSWRGAFATHGWIAIKPKNAAQYTVYQVVGWRLYRGLAPLMAISDVPDRNWFNQRPSVLVDLRGEKAAAAIAKIEAAIKAYPYSNTYRLWPGPNSNTFPAYIGRNVPELGLALPSTAIGKDFLPGGALCARAPSGTGYQCSLFGLLGVLAARKEGIEIDLLGLVYGIKFSPLSLLLPGVGSFPQ